MSDGNVSGGKISIQFIPISPAQFRFYGFWEGLSRCCAELDEHTGRQTFQDFPTHISTIFLVTCPNTIKSILINKMHY